MPLITNPGPISGLDRAFAFGGEERVRGENSQVCTH
jgi:hypothetical protein